MGGLREWDEFRLRGKDKGIKYWKICDEERKETGKISRAVANFGGWDSLLSNILQLGN